MVARKNVARRSKKAIDKERTPKKRPPRTAAHRRAQKGKPPRRKPFRPTPEQRTQVELMVGMGLTYKQIAVLTLSPYTGKGISTNTLQRAFVDELETGQPKIYAKVVQSLLKKALSDDHPQAATCAMFFLKCRHGWRQEEKIVHEIEGKTGVLVVPAATSVEDFITQVQTDNKAAKSPTDD